MTVKLQAEHKTILFKVEALIIQYNTNKSQSVVIPDTECTVIIIHKLISLCNWL